MAGDSQTDNQRQSDQVQPEATATDSTTSALEQIAKGETGGIKVPDNAIVSGKRIRNDVLRVLVDQIRDDSNVKDSDILNLILALDSAVESEKMTNEVLKTMNSNPEFFKNLDLNRLKEKQ
ncbi:MAG: hypothetical protein ACE5DX_05490 [Candidatus Dojkabacteria bacterium]